MPCEFQILTLAPCHLTTLRAAVVAARAARPHANVPASPRRARSLLREVDARTAALSRCGAELVSLRDKYAELERAQRATLAELRERDGALERLALDAGQAEHLDARELARRHRMLGGA